MCKKIDRHVQNEIDRNGQKEPWRACVQCLEVISLIYGLTKAELGARTQADHGRHDCCNFSWLIMSYTYLPIVLSFTSTHQG
jgi:hypothetical protein